MADKFLTLLEITKRGGCDAAVGLVEEVATVAPEMAAVMGRPIKGISYKAKCRSTLPASTTQLSGAVFRNANEGSDIVSSVYEQKRFDCFYLDAQFKIDEAVLQASEEGDSEAEILADEATGIVRNKAIYLGKQFYNGTTNDAKGFPGLKAFVNSSQTVDATGTGGTTYRAWFVWNDIQGIHFIFGNNAGLNMGEWMRQQVLDASSKSYMARVNNLAGYVGLSCADSHSVGYVKNLTSAKPLTDALAAELISKFPINKKPNLVFVERNSAFWLQRSRSATSITNRSTGEAGGNDVFAPLPNAIMGIPLIVTDSIASEAAF